jgi:hypothetical protein
MCCKLDLEQINLALVYFDIVSEKETCLLEAFSAAQLKPFFEEQCGCSCTGPSRKWPIARRAIGRRSSWRSPMPVSTGPASSGRVGVQGGQHRPLPDGPGADGDWQDRRHAVSDAQGPGAQQLDKVFFLTAKTPGRKLALDAAQVILDSADAPPLRVLEMVARDKACEHPDKACHGESCPLAQGFYDRLPAARQAASGSTC